MGSHAVQLAASLARMPEAAHLRVKTRGAALILVSAQGDDEHAHAKLTPISGNTFGLSLPSPSGRWQRTPFTGTLAHLLETLTDQLSFHLAPWP